MKILVVEDESNLQTLCRRLLEREGYEVGTASSGEEALPRLEEGWDLVLTDVTMPGEVDGLAVVREVRARGSADAVVMTGYPELDVVIGALRRARPLGGGELGALAWRAPDRAPEAEAEHANGRDPRSPHPVMITAETPAERESDRPSCAITWALVPEFHSHHSTGSQPFVAARSCASRSSTSGSIAGGIGIVALTGPIG